MDAPRVDVNVHPFFQSAVLTASTVPKWRPIPEDVLFADAKRSLPCVHQSSVESHVHTARWLTQTDVQLVYANHSFVHPNVKWHASMVMKETNTDVLNVSVNPDRVLCRVVPFVPSSVHLEMSWIVEAVQLAGVNLERSKSVNIFTKSETYESAQRCVVVYLFLLCFFTRKVRTKLIT